MLTLPPFKGAESNLEIRQRFQLLPCGGYRRSRGPDGEYTVERCVIGPVAGVNSTKNTAWISVIERQLRTPAWPDPGFDGRGVRWVDWTKRLAGRSRTVT
jgi:hypothetical protein